jgi:hypothetical protein
MWLKVRQSWKGYQIPLNDQPWLARFCATSPILAGHCQSFGFHATVVKTIRRFNLHTRFTPNGPDLTGAS